MLREKVNTLFPKPARKGCLIIKPFFSRKHWEAWIKTSLFGGSENLGLGSLREAEAVCVCVRGGVCCPTQVLLLVSSRGGTGGWFLECK